jgi:hypothetical protein
VAKRASGNEPGVVRHAHNREERKSMSLARIMLGGWEG